MTLVDVEISIRESVLPDEVLVFLREADQRVNQFVRNVQLHVIGFVPSDFVTVYRALRTIVQTNLAPGNAFCEWGSGFGVVASLASMLELDTCGIEIDRGLVDDSRKLADDFGLSVELIHGSFIPRGGEADVERAFAAHGTDASWLVTDADNAYDELGLEPDDFDLVFAYPWPGEEGLIAGLFEKYGAEGALLLTYNQFDYMRLQRKVGKRAGGF